MEWAVQGTPSASEFDSVALKALHSGALALSRQRRALRKKQRAKAGTSLSPARLRWKNDTLTSEGATPTAPGFHVPALFDKPQVQHHADSPIELQGLWLSPEQKLEPGQDRSDRQSERNETSEAGLTPRSFPGPTASIEVEAAALLRARRGLRGRSCPPSSRSERTPPTKASPSSPLRQIQLSLDPAPPLPCVAANGGLVCPVCGTCVGGATEVEYLQRTARDYAEEAQALAARLELAEELLLRAGPEGARSATLQHELDIERRRSEDLAEALRGMKTLAGKLYHGFEQQTLDFEVCVAMVRQKMDSTQENISNADESAQAALDAAALRAEHLHAENLHAEHLSASVRRDDLRVNELTSAIRGLHRQLNEESREVTTQRRFSSQWSLDKFVQEERIEELSRLESSMTAEYHEEHAHAARHRRQSTFLNDSVEESREQAVSVMRELQDSRLRIQKHQDELEASAALTLEHQERHVEVHAEYRQGQEEQMALQKHLDTKQEQERRKKAQLLAGRGLTPEVVDSLRLLQKGAELDRLDGLEPRQVSRMMGLRHKEKKPKWEPHFVCLAPAKGIGGGTGHHQLQWLPPQKSRMSNPKTGTLDLNTVTCIDFARGLPQEYLPRRHSWNAFSLWVGGHPNFFWTADTPTAEAFIVGLSRLCPNAEFVKRRDVVVYRTLYKSVDDSALLKAQPAKGNILTGQASFSRWHQQNARHQAFLRALRRCGEMKRAQEIVAANALTPDALQVHARTSFVRVHREGAETAAAADLSDAALQVHATTSEVRVHREGAEEVMVARGPAASSSRDMILPAGGSGVDAATSVTSLARGTQAQPANVTTATSTTSLARPTQAAHVAASGSAEPLSSSAGPSGSSAAAAGPAGSRDHETLGASSGSTAAGDAAAHAASSASGPEGEEREEAAAAARPVSPAAEPEPGELDSEGRSDEEETEEEEISDDSQSSTRSGSSQEHSESPSAMEASPLPGLP